MLDRLESDYDCANAGADLPKLKRELAEWQSKLEGDVAKETQDLVNRLENQIHFIENKCRIRS
ncbi:DUF2524 domain-containing protein [Paenibacillus sp. TRM 82003]|nr:DUF2524 domain-containing protein [Paenibacillus sp. TRM 82003]